MGLRPGDETVGNCGREGLSCNQLAECFGVVLGWMVTESSSYTAFYLMEGENAVAAQWAVPHHLLGLAISVIACRGHGVGHMFGCLYLKKLVS